MKSLVWLRNDLRMDDNPALKHACLNSDEVHCLYLYQPNQMKLHNVANCKMDFDYYPFDSQVIKCTSVYSNIKFIRPTAGKRF